jgi:sugar O-acyltransferase (sialic acid O-acetyltransferase NeuD family)
LVRLGIFGTGGMGRELMDIARRRTAGNETYSELTFVDDHPGGDVQGVRVLHPDQLAPEDRLVFAVGSPQLRRQLAERFAGRHFATVISGSSLVSSSAMIGEGGVLCDYSVINNSVRIGRYFQCNTFAQVSHDCVIGDFVTFSPRVTCNGSVHVGDGVFVGAGAVIRNGSAERPLRIGTGAIIGMGAVVVEDVADGAMVTGVPAREHRSREVPGFRAIVE